MAAHKLSISMDEHLLELARTAAEEEGTGLSAWIAEAVRDRVRRRALKEALDYMDKKFGAISPDEVTRIVEESRKSSIIVNARKKRR